MGRRGYSYGVKESLRLVLSLGWEALNGNGPWECTGVKLEGQTHAALSLDKVNKGCLENTTQCDGHKSRSLQLPQNRLGESSEEAHAQVRPFTPAPGAHDTHFLIIKDFRKLKRFIKTKNARANERAQQCSLQSLLIASLTTLVRSLEGRVD